MATQLEQILEQLKPGVAYDDGGAYATNPSTANVPGGPSGAMILNGKLYAPGGNFAGIDPEVLARFPGTSAQEYDNLINEDAPGNGAGKGSMKEGILSTVAAMMMMYGAGNALSSWQGLSSVGAGGADLPLTDAWNYDPSSYSSMGAVPESAGLAGSPGYTDMNGAGVLAPPEYTDMNGAGVLQSTASSPGPWANSPGYPNYAAQIANGTINFGQLGAELGAAGFSTGVEAPSWFDKPLGATKDVLGNPIGRTAVSLGAQALMGSRNSTPEGNPFSTELAQLIKSMSGANNTFAAGLQPTRAANLRGSTGQAVDPAGTTASMSLAAPTAASGAAPAAPVSTPSQAPPPQQGAVKLQPRMYGGS